MTERRTHVAGSPFLNVVPEVKGRAPDNETLPTKNAG